jgi:GTP-binding protein HflX
VIVADTVGFIDRLPHQLVAAFHATLEEVASADLLVHVIDAWGPDRERRIAAVRRVLEDVDAGGVPTIDVFNKIDRLDDEARRALRAARPDALLLSAASGDGREALVEAIAAGLAMDAERVHLELDGRLDRDRRLLADLYRHARVLSHTTSEADHVSIEAEVPRRLLDRVRRVKVPA